MPEIDLLMNGVTPAGSGTRLPADEAKTVMERMAALEKRFEVQQPAADSEAAMRRLLSELAAGKPDYDRMTPETATALKLLVTTDQKSLSRMGRVISTSFKRVNTDGIDVYHIVFENGDSDFEISLNEAGKIQHELYLPD
jgi:hypothetical protein